jgi:NADPH-dependent glutamate synthase beta subunit-like oxidoreductase
MPAFKKEVEEMEKEGIELVFLTSPVRFVPDAGRVKSLECIRMELKEVESMAGNEPSLFLTLHFRCRFSHRGYWTRT